MGEDHQPQTLSKAKADVSLCNHTSRHRSDQDTKSGSTQTRKMRDENDNALIASALQSTELNSVACSRFLLVLLSADEVMLLLADCFSPPVENHIPSHIELSS